MDISDIVTVMDWGRVIAVGAAGSRFAAIASVIAAYLGQAKR